MKILSYVLTLFVILFTITGCDICAKMPTCYQQKIHTIYIDNNVAVPNEMDYEVIVNPGCGGAVATVVGVPSCDPVQRDKINQAAGSYGIKIDKIVLSEFINQIKNKSSYKIVNKETADAELKITIFSYGFATRPLQLQDKLKPVIQIWAALIRNGKEIWHSRNFTTMYTPGMPLYSYDQLVQNPQNIDFGWKYVTHRVVSGIVKQM